MSIEKLIEDSKDPTITHMIGIPFLVERLSDLQVSIKNNPKIITEKEVNSFIVDDLTKVSRELKSKQCMIYLIIDRYIDSLETEIKEVCR